MLFWRCIVIGRSVGSKITEDYEGNLPSWIMWGIGISRRLRGRTSDIQDEATAGNASQAIPETWCHIVELGLIKLSRFGCPEMKKETYWCNKSQRQEKKQIKQHSGGVGQGPSTSGSTHARKYITFPSIRITLRCWAPFRFAGEERLEHWMVAHEARKNNRSS